MTHTIIYPNAKASTKKSPISMATVAKLLTLIDKEIEAKPFSSPLKKALLTGFHSTAKHNATKAVSPSSETMRTI